MRRQAIYFPDSPTKQISVLLFQLSRSARSSCTASIGLSVSPSIWSFMLSHPHRPTHFRHPCYPCHPCHLPHNTRKRRTCHPVTPHYILLHTCYTISLQCYTTVTPSYTSGYTLLHPCLRLFSVHKWRHHVMGGPRLPPPPCLHVLQMIIKKKQASCIWSSRKTGLLQMIIEKDRPLANDHQEKQASCKWS